MSRVWSVGVVAATLAVALHVGCSSSQPLEKGPVIPEAEWTAQVINRKGVVVADFLATWCGPCRAMKPIFEKVSKDLADKAGFIKVDVDQNPDLAQTYGIESIPTMILFKDGQPVARTVGSMREAEFRAWVEDQLK